MIGAETQENLECRPCGNNEVDDVVVRGVLDRRGQVMRNQSYCSGLNRAIHGKKKSKTGHIIEF